MAAITQQPSDWSELSASSTLGSKLPEMQEDVAPLPGCHPEVGLLLAALQDSTREYRENLEGTPDEAVTWQARPGGHSIGALLLHMAEVELYWIVEVGAEKQIAEGLMPEFDVDQDAGKWPTVAALPLAEYYALLDKVREVCIETAKTFDPEKVVVPGNWSEGATLRWILAHVVGHDSYHGGQAVLMRDLFDAQA